MLRHTWKGLKWVFLVPIVVFTILVAALFARLSFGPVSLNFLDTYIEHSLSKDDIQYHVSVETSTLSWDRSQGTLNLNVSNLRLLQEEQSVGHLPKAAVQWSVKDLLTLNFGHAELDIHNLSFTLPQGIFESSCSLETLQFPAQDAVLWGLKRFSRVELLHMKVLSGDKALPIGTMNARLSWPSGQRSWSGEASIQGALLKNLAPLFEGEKESFFEGIQTPTDLNILVRGSDFLFSKAQVTLKLGEGRLNLSPYFEAKYDVDSGYFKVDITPEKATLEEGVLKLKKGETVKVSGQVSHFEAPKIEAEVQVNSVQVNDLPGLWPENLGSVSHEWVRKNLRQGKIPKATLKLAMDWQQEGLKLSYLSGTIDIEGSSVRYMEKVPVIEAVSAHITCDDKTFTIRPKKGHVGSLLLKKGSVLTISKMDEEDQDMAADLKITGDMKGVFSLLNHPRFDLVSDLGIPFEKTFGQVEIDLKLDFPLERATTSDQVVAQANAHIAALRIEEIPLGDANKTFSVSSEKLSVHLKDGQLEMEGECTLGEAPFQLKFHKSFKKKVRQLTLETEHGKKLLEGFDIDLKKKIPEGEVKISFVHTENPGDFQQILVNADFSKAVIDIPFLGLKKPLQEQGAFSSVIEKKSDEPWNIKECFLDLGSHAYIQGQGTYGNQGLEFLELQGKTAGAHEGKITVRRGPQGYHIVLNAQVLDLFSLLHGWEEDSEEEQEEDLTSSTPVHFLISSEALKISEKQVARHLKGAFQGTVNRFDSGSLEAQNLNDEKAFLKMSLVPEKKGKRTLLKLKVRDAGDLLNTLGVEGIEGGTLVLNATRNNVSRGDWMGRLRLKNFVATNMPEMIQVLHLASPLGIFEFFSDDTSLRFEEAKVDVRFEKDKIVLAEGRASGSEIGFTLSGTVDLAQERLALEGSIIPASFFNTLISYIPILGELLLGGEGEGIFGISYAIRGPFGDTKASVNPLSILTPGFLRKIFGS